MSNIKFGTDGWRGIIADDFTFNNVRIAAQAIADFINKISKDKASMVIGYDRRFLSSEFARSAAEVLAGNNIKVFLSKAVVPTPVVCMNIRKRNLAGGIMLTASHNPPEFNGLKFRDSFGGSVGKETTSQIEHFLGKKKVVTLKLEEAEKKGLIEVIDFIGDYCELVRGYLDMELLKKSNFHILVDSMYGSGDRLIEKMLKDTGCKVETIHGENNPSFDGVSPEPIGKNLTELSSLMRKGRYEIGLATDGDADRLGAVSPSGDFINPHKIFSLLLLHLFKNKGLRGVVVKTISSTVLLDNIAEALGLKLYETPVGFKYIVDYMKSKNVLIGGEESGGIGFKGYLPERDGSLSGLLLLEMMALEKKGITELLKDMEDEFGRFYYYREDFHYLEDLRPRITTFLKGLILKDLAGVKVIDTKTYDGMKFIGEDKSWLLFRLSGTEPVVRIYAEAPAEKRASSIIESGKKMIADLFRKNG